MLNNNNSSLHISMQTLHKCIPSHARVYLTMFICIWSCSCIAPHIHAYPAMLMYITPCSCIPSSRCSCISHHVHLHVQTLSPVHVQFVFSSPLPLSSFSLPPQSFFSPAPLHACRYNKTNMQWKNSGNYNLLWSIKITWHGLQKCQLVSLTLIITSVMAEIKLPTCIIDLEWYPLWPLLWHLCICV